MGGGRLVTASMRERQGKGLSALGKRRGLEDPFIALKRDERRALGDVSGLGVKRLGGGWDEIAKEERQKRLRTAYEKGTPSISKLGKKNEDSNPLLREKPKLIRCYECEALASPLTQSNLIEWYVTVFVYADCVD